MPKTAVLRLTNKKNGNETQVSATLEDEEFAILEAYYQYVKELSSAKLLKDGFPTSLNVSYVEGKGTTFSAKLPPDDDVIVLLFKLRPFILHDEHASYNRVTSILGKHFADSNFRSFLKSQRELYDGRNFQSQLQIKVGDTQTQTLLNSEKVLFDWLNAFQYHRAQDKKRAIEALHTLLPLEVGRAIFLILLSDKTVAIFNISQIVGMFLGKTKSVAFSC